MRRLISYIAGLQPKFFCSLRSSIYLTAHQAHPTSFCTNQVTMGKSFSANSMNYLMLLQPPTLIAAILMTLRRMTKVTLDTAVHPPEIHYLGTGTIAILRRSNHHPQNQMKAHPLKKNGQGKTIKTIRTPNPHLGMTKILQRINRQTQN